MTKSSPTQRTTLEFRPWLVAAFLFAALQVAAVDANAQIQYRFDNDNTTLILENYPSLTENFVSGGSNGIPAIGNRVIMKGNGNLYVDIMGDSTIAGSGFESLEMDGPAWLIAGTVTLTGTSATTFHVKSGTQTIGGPLSGMGSVTATNGTGPKATIDEGATLVVGNNGGVGTLSVGGIVNNGLMVFARTGYTYNDNISGTGTVIQTVGALTLTGSNSYSGGTHIDGGGLIAKNAFAVGTGKIEFLSSYNYLSMQLATPADITFHNQLVGTGLVVANLGSGTKTFSFASDAGDQFKGSFQMEQGVLDLSKGTGATALAHSTLYLSATSTAQPTSVYVGSGDKKIGNLVLARHKVASTTYYTSNGGAMIFDVNIGNPAAPVGDSHLSVGDFALVSSGTLSVSATVRLATTSTAPLTTPVASTVNLLEQDDANIIANLITASGSVSVNTSKFTLVGANNATLSNAQTRDVMQASSGTVAKATYDYRLTTGANNDGLYVNYGLTNIEVLSGKMLELRNSGSGGYSPNTLSARVTGAGGLDIYATGTMLLNGVSNSYTGATVVNSGNVVVGENNSFGNTSGLHVKSGASVDMNGRWLLVGQNLLLDNGSSLNINGGYLRLVLTATSGNSVIAPNSLSGGGTFRVEIPSTGTGSVIFEGDNPDFSALITVANQSTKGSKVILKSADALGTGLILAGYSSAFVYENVTGTVRTSSTMPSTNPGYVVFQSSTVFMTGVTRAATQLIDSDVTYGPTANLAGSGTISVDANSTMRLGLINNVTVSNPLQLNGGALDFVAPTRTETPRATINNLYGTGTIWMNANPNTGDSNIIAFKNVVGNFDLKIRMMEEARTGSQIMPIYSSTIPDIQSRIVLANGQVESGVYVFKLIPGTADNIFMPDTNMMYLVNDNGKVSRAAKAIASTAAVIGAEWHYSLDNVTKRMGDLRAEFFKGSEKPRGNLWARMGNQAIIAKESLCGAAFDEDFWVFNAGADIAFHYDTATLFFGAFGGVGRADRTFTNLGDGTSDSIILGAYATWMNEKGWFIDLVGKQDMLKNKFHAISSDGSRIDGNYDGKVSGVSLEVGKQIELTKSKVTRWWLEPSLQAAYALIKSDDYVTDSGIAVHLNSSSSQQYRAQLRFGYQEKGAKFQPYLKASVVYSTSSGGVISADDRALQADFDGIRYEAGIGGSYIINKTNQVYAEYEYAKADTYQRKWSFNLGYRHAW